MLGRLREPVRLVAVAVLVLAVAAVVLILREVREEHAMVHDGRAGPRRSSKSLRIVAMPQAQGLLNPSSALTTDPEPGWLSTRSVPPSN